MMPFPPVAPEDAHVLLIEDNIFTCQVVVELLRQINIASCTVVHSLSELERALAQHERAFTVALVDIHMPQVPGGGYAVIHRLQQTTVRKIAFTAAVVANEEQRLRAAGFDSLCEKPIQPDDFQSFVMRILKGEVVWNAFSTPTSSPAFSINQAEWTQERQNYIFSAPQHVHWIGRRWKRIQSGAATPTAIETLKPKIHALVSDAAMLQFGVFAAAVRGVYEAFASVRPHALAIEPEQDRAITLAIEKLEEATRDLTKTGLEKE